MQLQDEKKNIQVLEFGVSNITDLLVITDHSRYSSLNMSSSFWLTSVNEEYFHCKN